MSSTISKKPVALSVSEFVNFSKDNSITVLDLRHQDEFVKQHIQNSLFIGIVGPFDKWVQLLVVNKSTPLILILPKDTKQDSLTRLYTLGYTNVIGFLRGGIENWLSSRQPTISVNSISAKDFVLKRASEELNSIDIRKLSEFETAHMGDVSLVPLTFEEEFINTLSTNKKYHIFCGGGYRSVIAISFLMKNGIKNATNIEGGFRGIQAVLSKIN